MQINLIYDTSIPNTAASFIYKNALQMAAEKLASNFTNNETINIQVGEVAGIQMSNKVACSTANTTKVSYVDYVNALSKIATSPDAISTIDYLKTLSDPTHGSGVALTSAQQKTLGFISPANQAIDGYIGFNANLAFTPTQDYGITTDTYDFTSAAYHEMTEVLGRYAGGSAIYGYNALDLSRFTSPGHNAPFNGSNAPAYFSTDGGKTPLAYYNNLASSGDLGDWNTSSNDSFGSGNSGHVQIMTSVDVREMSVLGYNLSTIGETIAYPSPIVTTHAVHYSPPLQTTSVNNWFFGGSAHSNSASDMWYFYESGAGLGANDGHLHITNGFILENNSWTAFTGDVLPGNIVATTANDMNSVTYTAPKIVGIHDNLYAGMYSDGHISNLAHTSIVT